MKKTILALLFLQQFFFYNIIAQSNYVPNKKLREYFNEYDYSKYKNTSLSGLNYYTDDFKKIEKKLWKCTNLDSNFIYPYALLAKIKHAKKEFFGRHGAFELYSKYINKNRLFPYGRLCPSLSDYEQQANLYSEDECVYKVRTARIRCLLDAYKYKKELFDKTKNDGTIVTTQTLSVYFSIVEKDLDEATKATIQDYFDFYSLLADFEYNNGNYEESAKSYQKILDKIPTKTRINKDDLNIVKQVYEKIYNISIINDDYETAENALSSYFKLPHTKDDRRKLDFKNKQKEIIRLINLRELIKGGNYEVCIHNGQKVFCDNKNISINNYSSALQFLYLYNNSNILQTIFDLKTLGRNTQSNGSYEDSYQIEDAYEFYLNYGQELGMIWPKYMPISYDSYLADLEISKWLFSEFSSKVISNMAKCGCIGNNVFDVKNTDNISYLFSKSKKDSNLTAKFIISDDWTQLLNIAVKYYDPQGNEVFKTKNGEELPTRLKCQTLYDIEKRNYENEQAIIRAQQLQQEQELRRLELERNNREAQIRILEEENRKRENEIALSNAQTLQLEKKKELENQKAAAAFMKLIFSANSTNTSTSEPTQSTTSTQKSSTSSSPLKNVYICTSGKPEECCRAVVVTSSRPKGSGCCSRSDGRGCSSGHPWSECGKEGNKNYLCNYCGISVRLESYPKNSGCCPVKGCNGHSWSEVK
jgi:hypothetical protein